MSRFNAAAEWFPVSDHPKCVRRFLRERGATLYVKFCRLLREYGFAICENFDFLFWCCIRFVIDYSV